MVFEGGFGKSWNGVTGGWEQWDQLKVTQKGSLDLSKSKDINLLVILIKPIATFGGSNKNGGSPDIRSAPAHPGLS